MREEIFESEEEWLQIKKIIANGEGLNEIKILHDHNLIKKSPLEIAKEEYYNVCNDENTTMVINKLINYKDRLEIEIKKLKNSD